VRRFFASSRGRAQARLVQTGEPLRPPRAALRIAATLSFALLGCESEPAPASEPAAFAHTRPDKASLYADASLLPTRAGERARRELALAGQLSAALEHLALTPLQIDVRLGQPPSVVVIASRAHSPDASPSEIVAEDIRELCLATIPDLDPAGVHLWLRPAPADSAPRELPRPRSPLWALVFACIGFGLSLGVSLERLRGRRKLA